jgi:CDP-diacylglycerol--glycerol-3-phosphate 3-phosphatidyltransferase
MSASHPSAGELPRGSSLLSNRLKEAGRAFLAPLVRLAQRLGITANRVTLAGFCIVVVGAVMVAIGQLLIGAVVLIAGSLLDAVDGALARATGGSTAFGGFLDSTLDRAAEAILYVGIVAYLLGATADPLWPVLLALAALSGSFMVSYTRAKAEAIGLSASVGLAPRTERLVLIVAGIALTGLGVDFGLLGAIGIIAALSAATTIQRIWHVRQQVAATQER